MLEVQLHQARIIEICREVVSSARISAHAEREMVDMLWVPVIVVANLATARDCERLIAK
jgi:hypothetical protein